MLQRSAVEPARSYRLDISSRGYQVLFHVDETNRCPGCGRSQWFVGRITAECGFCGTAVPLAESARTGLNPLGQQAVALHVLRAPPATNFAEKRRHPRIPADGRMVALHVDGSPRAFALQNISDSGVMGLALPGLGEAASLVVELEDGTLLPAELKWCDGTSAGLAFLKAA